MIPSHRHPLSSPSHPRHNRAPLAPPSDLSSRIEKSIATAPSASATAPSSSSTTTTTNGNNDRGDRAADDDESPRVTGASWPRPPARSDPLPWKKSPGNAAPDSSHRQLLPASKEEKLAVRPPSSSSSRKHVDEALFSFLGEPTNHQRLVSGSSSTRSRPLVTATMKSSSDNSLSSATLPASQLVAVVPAASSLSPSTGSAATAIATATAASSATTTAMMPGSAAMVVTDDYHSTNSLSSTFTWQKLSLDRAVAPLLKEPVAPFVSRSNERKRALLNATYYSECFLHSIGPTDADTAALDAQSRYEKWWVGSTYRGGGTGGGDREKRRGVTSAATITTTDTAAATQDEDDAEQGGSSISHHHVKRRRVSGRNRPEDDASDGASGFVGPCTIPHPIDVDDDLFLRTDPIATTSSWSVDRLKAALVEDLRQSGGDVTTATFVDCLDRLHGHYRASGMDERWGSSTVATPADGTWIALSKPTFTECLGRNDRGQYLYTLGRLSFDMFRPTSLKCSLQGVFNTVSLLPIDIENEGKDGMSTSTSTTKPLKACPRRMVRSLQGRYGQSGVPVGNYDIVVAFTIEAHQTRRGEIVATATADPTKTTGSSAPQSQSTTNSTPLYRVPRPIRGLLTNHGYVIPDPNIPNRLSIWFTGGTLECHQDEDLDDWRELFHHGDLPRRDLGELARVLAAKVLLGATSVEGMNPDDGSMSYHLRRPIGGHGQVFCDVLYGDHDLRILRGHHGTVYVHRRVPNEDSSDNGRATRVSG